MFAITKKITTHFSIIIQRYIQYYIMYGLSMSIANKTLNYT